MSGEYTGRDTTNNKLVFSQVLLTFREPLPKINDLLNPPFLKSKCTSFCLPVCAVKVNLEPKKKHSHPLEIHFQINVTFFQGLHCYI